MKTLCLLLKWPLLTVDKVAKQYLCTLQIVRLHCKITLPPHCVSLLRVVVVVVTHFPCFLNGGKLIARGVEQTVMIKAPTAFAIN